MAAQKGKLFLLKAGDGGAPETFTTVAGLRATSFSVNGEEVDATTKDDDGWQRRLAGAGVRSVTITASGIVQDSAVEETLRARAFSQSLDNYQLTFESGDVLVGAFQLRRYERTGDFDGAEAFALTLASHGQPTYTTG